MPAGLADGDWTLRTASLSAVLLTSCLANTMTVTVPESPKILKPENDTISTKRDSKCTIPCVASTRWPQFCLVYWIVNNRFIEDMYPDGRVKEEAQSFNKSGGRIHQVERPLVIASTEAEDFTRTFTCVVQDPSGFDVKNITLVEAGREQTNIFRCKKRKNRSGKKTKNRHLLTKQLAVDQDF